MPEMSGGQLAAAVKKHASDVPVIMLTGFGDAMKENGACPDCVDMVLSKPVTEDNLRDALARLLSELAKKQEGGGK